jgi:hypothetical protein
MIKIEIIFSFEKKKQSNNFFLFLSFGSEKYKKIIKILKANIYKYGHQFNDKQKIKK